MTSKAQARDALEVVAAEAAGCTRCDLFERASKPCSGKARFDQASS